MAPTFQIGEVLCHDITTTSARIAWPKPADKKYPVYGYRVCTAEVGSRGFEVRPQSAYMLYDEVSSTEFMSCSLTNNVGCFLLGCAFGGHREIRCSSLEL